MIKIGVHYDVYIVISCLFVISQMVTDSEGDLNVLHLFLLADVQQVESLMWTMHGCV